MCEHKSRIRKFLRKVLYEAFPIIGSKQYNNAIISKSVKKLKREEEINRVTENLKAPYIKDSSFVEKMYDDVLTNSSEFRNTAETKGTAFLGAAGIAASLVTVGVGLLPKNLFSHSATSAYLNILSTMTGIIFICATISFVLAGLSSLRALTAREYYSPTEKDIHRHIGSGKENERWFAEGIVNSKSNDYLLTIKNNWLYAAERHFVYALIYLGVGVALLVLSQLVDITIQYN